MRWPFSTKKETDLRIFRDPKTNHVMLRLVGPTNFPIFGILDLSTTVTMDVELDQEGIDRLFQQLGHFAKHEFEVDGPR